MTYSVPIPIALGASKAGLTLNAQLKTAAGADTGSPITSGFTEVGNGNYQWYYAGFADGTSYGVRFYEQGVPGTILAVDVITPAMAVNPLGAGAVEYTLIVQVGVTLIDGAEVWITTDSAGTNIVASGTTDGNGELTVYLDAGTYYAWWQHAGYNPTNPTSFTVS